jgi:hypothetical protein
MKAKTFENLIRKIVREEIDYSLRREIKSLKEDLRDELKPTITEHKERLVEVPKKPTIPETAKNSLKEKIMGSQPFKNQHFSSDPALNNLLNETAAAGPINLDAPGPSPEMSVESMPDPVAKAVTRDYSGLMKAIEQKKGR